MDSSEDDIYINEGYIQSPKPKISIEQKNELLKKGYDSTCKISIPDVNKGNGYFCQIFYNRQNYDVLILNHIIIEKEQFTNQIHFKIRYEKKILFPTTSKILDLNFKMKNIFLLK